MRPDLTVDLTATLPAGVPIGGTFRVAPGGAPLPQGVSLSSAGILSATGAVIDTETAGIVFAYDY